MEDIALVISLGLSALIIYLGRLHGAKKEGIEMGGILTELKNIQQNLQEFKEKFEQADIEKVYTDINVLKTELVNFKEHLYLVNKRIDKHLSQDHLKKE